jgi:hypothetical protein
MRSRNNYRYPFPGKVAKAAGPFSEGRDECPSHDGDGICAATTWRGMASGGVVASTLLLVAYKEKHVLGGSRSAGGKLRLRRFLIVDVIDGLDLLCRSGKGANLYGANLSGANLYGANLPGANLSGAVLSGAKDCVWVADPVSGYATRKAN